jgi:hypothetical protein
MMLFPSTVARELISQNGDHGQRGKLAAVLFADLDDRITARGELMATLKKYAHGCKVLILESGRDCDCVEYFGVRHVIDATPAAFNALRADIAEYADGPFRLEVSPWTDETEYVSRDLALEAYEDGHPHHIVSQF